MEYSVLVMLWYLVLCAAVSFYVVLDGFDMGVGALHLLAKNDEERRIFLNAIGPVWDGNEVWLVIIGGALFSGFPLAYAVLCSAFYIPIMLLLVAIVFRAVAIEFRSKMEHASWRFVWDVVFSISSIVMALLFGVLLGNLVQGIPLGSDTAFIGTFWDFLTPYTLLVGVTGIATFSMHGSIFLLMKTEGDLHERLRGWVHTSIAIFGVFFIILTMATHIYQDHMIVMIRDYPALFILPALGVIFMANIPYQIYHGNDWYAFLSSSASITLLFSLFAVGTFPHLIKASNDPANSITIYNSASSPYTLQIILIIAAIGVPLVLAYGYWIYRIFRGKVVLSDASY